MFVIRYLIAALVMVATVAGWGISAGYSFWQVLGLVLAATLVLQMAILAYVGIAAHRRKRAPSRGVRKRSDQLVILPR